MSASAYCIRCIDLNLSCIFPEDSEQCQQSQDSQVRCDGSTSDEGFQRLEDELREIEEKMDAILKEAIPDRDIFRVMKERWSLLEGKKQSLRFNKQDAEKRKIEQ